MLVGADQLEVHPIGAVEQRREHEIEPPFVVSHMPRLHELQAVGRLLRVRTARFLENAEVDAMQLVCNAVHEHHVLRRGRRVAETVAQVQPEAMRLLGGLRAALAVLPALRHGPVPRVVARPHAAAPIEQAERVAGAEPMHEQALLEAALRAHGDDLLVVVERERVFGPRRGDDHGVLRLVVEHGLERQVVRVVEIGEPYLDAALTAFHFEAERHAVVLERGHALGGRGGQLEAPERKRRDHAGRMRGCLAKSMTDAEMSPT